MFFGFLKSKKEKELEFVSDVLAVAMFFDGTATRNELEEAAKIIKSIENSTEALQIGITRIHSLVGEFRKDREKFYAAQDRVDAYLQKQTELKDKVVKWIQTIFTVDTKALCEREELYLGRFSSIGTV